MNKRILLLFILSVFLCGCNNDTFITTEDIKIMMSTEAATEVTYGKITEILSAKEHTTEIFSSDVIAEIPSYDNAASIELNNNVPLLNTDDAQNGVFIHLSELDSLGRCGVAYMCAGSETLPSEERGSIGHVRPSGWHTVKYPELIEGNYLYNRCHLLMFALSGLNDDERNLITGTRSFNAGETNSMLYYENLVLDYIQTTGNHVLYKVTPIYTGNNLVADGVQMEALSVEDNNLSFNVFVYNVQPGIKINYATGESSVVATDSSKTSFQEDFVINVNTGKFHLPTCTYASDISPKNKKYVNDTYNNIITNGYTPCSICIQSSH